MKMTESTVHHLIPASGLQDKSRRGSAYVAVLAASVLVIIIGLGALTATRLAAQTATLNNDAADARLLARSAVELALLHVQDHSAAWRQDFADEAVLQDVPLGRGHVSIYAYDPDDGDLLDDATDPVVIRGEGRIDEARALIETRIDADGVVQAGSWRIATD